MPNYGHIEQKVEPLYKVQEQRPVGVIATVLALALATAWPIALGVLAGVAGWLFLGETWPLRIFPAVGVAGGILLSGSVLLGSFAIQRVLHHAPPAPVPNAITLNFEGALEQTTNHVVVPLRTHRVLVEGVPAADLCWFIVGLCDHGMPISQRAWRGLRAPSGVIVSSDYWASMVKPLRAAGVVADMSHRRTGRLTLSDREGVLRLMALDPYDPALYVFHRAADTERVAASLRVRRGDLLPPPRRDPLPGSGESG